MFGEYEYGDIDNDDNSNNNNNNGKIFEDMHESVSPASLSLTIT